MSTDHVDRCCRALHGGFSLLSLARSGSACFREKRASHDYTTRSHVSSLTVTDSDNNTTTRNENALIIFVSLPNGEVPMIGTHSGPGRGTCRGSRSMTDTYRLRDRTESDAAVPVRYLSDFSPGSATIPSDSRDGGSPTVTDIVGVVGTTLDGPQQSIRPPRKTPAQ